MTSKENETSYPFPPLTPAADECPAPDNAAFAAECVANIQDLPMAKEWVLRKQLVTRTDVWGYVWRADYEFPDKSWAPMVSRLVCFRMANGQMSRVVAGPQAIPPL